MTQKGNKVLIYLGFEYVCFRAAGETITWRCRQSRQMKCHAMIRTAENRIVQMPIAHCHDSCPQKLEVNAAKLEMKESMKSVGATSRNVIGSVLSKVNNETLVHMPKKSSLSRNLQNFRKKDNFSNPTTIQFSIPEKFRELILHDSGENDPDRILAFGDKGLLSQLDSETI